jgi:hypothetical protein
MSVLLFYVVPALVLQIADRGRGRRVARDPAVRLPGRQSFLAAVVGALHQIGHALDQNAIAGAHSGEATGVRDRVLSWLQQHLRQLPTGTQLLHPVATYGHKAGEAVVAIFFTLAATWYCVSERDAIIKLLTASRRSRNATRRARPTSRSTAASAPTRGFAS